MIEPKTLDELGKRILAALPPGLEQLSEDARKNARAAMSAALAKADLVTREEFDVQAAVLARTRAKLTELERVVTELGENLNERQSLKSS
jgi:BMFP domain-containing protein YqiC